MAHGNAPTGSSASRSALLGGPLAGAFTQQIEKDERAARKALDAKLQLLEATEGEVRLHSVAMSSQRGGICC